MLASLDDRLLGFAGRVLHTIQERFGVSPPTVLRENLHAGLVTYGGAAIAMFLTGDLVSILIVLATVPFAAPSTMRLLKRYSADSRKDWSSDLARKYMALALGRRESMRNARGLLLLFTLAIVALHMVTPARHEGLSGVIFMIFWFVAMAHEYLSAAEPRGPGDRRRVGAPKLAGLGS